MFWLGANYWPSNYGVRMWEKWSPDEVDRELDGISAMGCRVVRVFILWECFQPAADGVDEAAMAKFDRLLRSAADRGLKLIPTFTVGHMSGENWDVSWRDGRDIYADPAMLRAQSRLVTAFAGRYRGEEAILAWDLGNEPENFAKPPSVAAGWLWLRFLSQEIKVLDPGHPVTVGLCLDSLTRDTGFRPAEAAEATDFLCMHAYPGYSSLCPDVPQSPRASLLPAFACLLTRGLGGKDVLFEEFGASDQMVDAEIVGGYYRAVLPSLLLNGALGGLAWCAGDFDPCALDLPYETTPYEIGFGLADAAGNLKAAGRETKEFSRLLEDVGDRIGPPLGEVCILLPDRYYDHPDPEVTPLRLAAALFNAFILAKRAGLHPLFRRPEEDLTGVRLFIAPCVPRRGYFRASQWRKLLELVAAGKGLYLSYAGLAIDGLAEAAGVRILHPRFPEEREVCLEDAGLGTSLCYRARTEKRLQVVPDGAQVLLQDAAGGPGAVLARHGEGWMLLVTHPVEHYLADTPDAYAGVEAERTHLLYRRVAETLGMSTGIFPPEVEARAISLIRGDSWLAVNHGAAEVVFGLPGAAELIRLEGKEARLLPR